MRLQLAQQAARESMHARGLAALSVVVAAQMQGSVNEKPRDLICEASAVLARLPARSFTRDHDVAEGLTAFMSIAQWKGEDVGGCVFATVPPVESPHRFVIDDHHADIALDAGRGAVQRVEYSPTQGCSVYAARFPCVHEDAWPILGHQPPGV
jgi:hypothetical protein